MTNEYGFFRQRPNNIFIVINKFVNSKQSKLFVMMRMPCPQFFNTAILIRPGWCRSFKSLIPKVTLPGVPAVTSYKCACDKKNGLGMIDCHMNDLFLKAMF